MIAMRVNEIAIGGASLEITVLTLYPLSDDSTGFSSCRGRLVRNSYQKKSNPCPRARLRREKKTQERCLLAREMRRAGRALSFSPIGSLPAVAGAHPAADPEPIGGRGSCAAGDAYSSRSFGTCACATGGCREPS
jgi:hypothetical protein